MANWDMLLVIILDLVVIGIIFINARYLLNALNSLLDFTCQWSMILLDLCLFGRNYYFKILQRRQMLIDKARRENKTLLYILITRVHYLIGFFCLCHVVSNILSFTDPFARFIEMAENTIVGSLMEMLDILSFSNETNESFLLIVFGNFIAVWLFIPRYDADMDSATLNWPTRFILGAFETVLFSATVISISDLLIKNNKILIILLIAGMAYIYILGKALLIWVKDMLNAFASLGILFLIAWVINNNSFLETAIETNEQFSLIISVMLAQKIVDLVVYRWCDTLLFDGSNNVVRPRRYIRKRYNNPKTEIPPPEYYDIEIY